MPASGGIQRHGAVLTRPRETAGERPAIWGSSELLRELAHDLRHAELVLD
jgi:hypothetical protein